MKYFLSFVLGLIILLLSSEIHAQVTETQKINYPNGISLEYGIGNYADTDEYISKEKYSGTLPYYKIGWTNQHDNYIYQLGIEYRYSSALENYNVSADINQFSLIQGFLYPLPKFSLFKKDVHTFIGPSTEIFFYHNEQNIAVSGFDYAQSFAALFSIGISSELFIPIQSNFNIESSLGFSVLSLGFRIVDEEETDESPIKPLTLFSGINATFKLGTRYCFYDTFSLKAAYLFSFTRISSWEPLFSASDNLVLTLTCGF